MDDDGLLSHENTAFLEEEVLHGLRLWYIEAVTWIEWQLIDFLYDRHVIGIALFSILCITVLLCCCFRFRIPRWVEGTMNHRALLTLPLWIRTKQEIEADYQRRKIVKKFRKRIQKFENSEMDAEMDLKKGETLCGAANIQLKEKRFFSSTGKDWEWLCEGVPEDIGSQQRKQRRK